MIRVFRRAGERAGGATLGPVIAAALLGAGSNACSEPGLAKSHVFDNGAGGAELPAPVMTVPATGSTPELAYFRVDGSRLAGLRA